MKKTDIKNFVQILKDTYPDATCSLDFKTPFQMVVAVMLSAQCTDARVNIVCRELFSVFPTPESMAYGDLAEIERIVKPCGLYRMKASNIKDASRMLVEDYGGVIPREMDELLKLTGYIRGGCSPVGMKKK